MASPDFQLAESTTRILLIALTACTLCMFYGVLLFTSFFGLVFCSAVPNRFFACAQVFVLC